MSMKTVQSLDHVYSRDVRVKPHQQADRRHCVPRTDAAFVNHGNPAFEIGVVGCGSMGGGLALLLAERGLNVWFNDPSTETVDALIKSAKDQGFGSRVHKSTSHEELCHSLDEPKVFLFSLPHGTVGDTVLHSLMPYLKPDDIILDAGNEHYKNTQRRQSQCTTRGIKYVGMGVSGGYQAARRGPSMCPGGDAETLRDGGAVMRLLMKVAARDGDKPDGMPCVGNAGFGGAGHYVKCLHNGIEHGMMSAIAEAWYIMSKGLGMSTDETSSEFKRWATHGEFRNTFLIDISVDICSKRNPSTLELVLPTVLDKVVQDLTGEEGTGIWSSEEAVRLHVPAPTLTTAHYFRVASAYRGKREKVNNLFAGAFASGAFAPRKLGITGSEQQKAFLEDLRKSVWATCLASYIQGVNVIEEANKEQGWRVNYEAVWHIWRAGCIIQSDHISELLEPIFKSHKQREHMNLLLEQSFAEELKDSFKSMRTVVSTATSCDFAIPSISATLDWIKYQGGTDLPTSFYEAQLDYFGNHMYDRRGDDAPNPTEGKHHFEWKPA